MTTERLATTDDWIKGCAIAWRALSRGEEGAQVNEGEAWACAIARCAGRVLLVWNYRRPIGPVPNEWEKVVKAFAGKGSCARDGLVQTWDGRKLIEQLPKVVPDSVVLASSIKEGGFDPSDDTPRFHMSDGSVLT